MLKGNKLLLALLLPVFVLAFCLAAFALDESDFIIIDGDHFTPEEWAAKQDYMANNKALKTDVEQPLVAAAPRDGMNPNDPALKTSPKIQNAVDKAAPATNLLFEDFESGVVPPTGWTADVTNAGFTWKSASSSPYNGTYYTNCEYDPALVPQDEWLISPVVDLTTGGSSWVLEFHWLMSYYWGVDPNDNYDLEVWISTDGGANFNTMLWDESQAGEFTNWTWYEVTIDLTAYLTETNVAFGFRYVGVDGAEGAFDYISVNDDPLPSGRCCYGDPAAPSCADETQGDCTSRPDFISWDEGLDCTNNPCPVAGAGDDCTNPLVATFPADFVSDQYVNTNYTCGRGDAYNGTTCMGYYDGGEDIIYEFTVTEDVFVDITLDPKGTTYTGFAVSTDCPPTNCLINTSSSSGSPYGVTSAVVPAGTYYVMVDTWPSPDCIADFDLTIDYLGVPPAAPANDQCADAEPIAGPFPQTVTGTTINSTVDCPGLLDWQAVWYSFENPYSCGNVTIDYCGTSPELVTVGVVLMDDCACDDYILHSNTTWDECPADGNPTSYWNGLSAGTYYYPAFTGPGTYGGQTQDFQFTLDIQECPPAPANDECSGAEAITLGTPTSGTTVGATIDCPSIFDEWYGVWYQFTLSSTDNCNDVSVSYCGSSGASPSTVSATLVAENSEPDCCDEASMYYFTSGAFDCPNGWPQLTFEDIPDGTYYYVVAFGADPYDFVVEINAVDCPPSMPGDNCTDPLKVTVNSSADLPYVDNNYTCGRGNNESNTCMSYYDGGEDIFYEINVNTSFNAIFTLDPQGTSYSGMALGASCPPPGSSYSDCLAEVTSSSGSAKSFSIELTPGTYYLMIDTWPSPDCIPAFTLTIEELIPEPGDNCSDPLKVNLPSDAPYMDIGQTTCGRIDDYSSTCLSSYDGGEDILYEINIDEAGYYEFIHDPKGTSWTGMGLGADCPPPGSGYSDCIAEATDYSGDPHGFVVLLEPGTYYLMIDTWPSPDCIPDFDLTINYLEPPTLEYDQTLIEFCQVGVDESGCTTLNLGNSGDVDMDFEVMIDYGDPLPKEIDGANITTTAGFTPGATADVMFTISNASSDAEWIDE
ncbi:MAG: hypothetical protein GF310_10410, partial [candidate division Zixibacteria bacterium]|nr:hypothetical protein [candidate division Zixibacteria bacterium]